MKQVEEFENYKIQEGSIQFDNNAAISFGYIGWIFKHRGSSKKM